MTVLHRVDLVDIQGLTVFENRQDDCQADGGFGRGDYHYEEGDEVAVDLLPAIGKRDEAEVHGVEHQLDRHEHGDDVAPEEKAGDTQGKQDRTEDEVPGNGNAVHQSISFRAR